jgi:hypothetical protein
MTPNLLRLLACAAYPLIEEPHCHCAWSWSPVAMTLMMKIQAKLLDQNIKRISYQAPLKHNN